MTLSWAVKFGDGSCLISVLNISTNVTNNIKLFGGLYCNKEDTLFIILSCVGDNMYLSA